MDGSTRQIWVKSLCSYVSGVTTDITYKCHYYAKVFKRPFHLREHERVHIRQKLFTCTQCNIQFSDLFFFKKHQRIHNSRDPGKVWICDFCSVVFEKKSEFLSHHPFLDGDVPRSTSYGVYISQLIRFARVSSHVVDFNARNKSLTAKLLQQGYRSS